MMKRITIKSFTRRRVVAVAIIVAVASAAVIGVDETQRLLTVVMELVT